MKVPNLAVPDATIRYRSLQNEYEIPYLTLQSLTPPDLTLLEDAAPEYDCDWDNQLSCDYKIPYLTKQDNTQPDTTKRCSA